MSPARTMALALALACAAGCVTKSRHRYVRMQPDCFSTNTDPVPGSSGEKRDYPSLDCRSANYKVGFIEFAEDGTLVDREQQRKVLALIQDEKKKSKGKVITVLYVHGWKNNADQARPGGTPKDGEKFRNAIADMGARVPGGTEGKPEVPVVGVYIGWKGKTLKGPGLFTFLSYWGRRGVANRVGDGGVADAINGVIDASNGVDPDHPMGDGSGSRVLLLGHSFGARVLERALERVPLYVPIAGSAAVRPRVDLVLFVNAANDSRLSTRRVLDLQKSKVTVRHPNYDPATCAETPHDRTCGEYPLLVAVTSTADLATRVAQPAANTLGPDDDTASPMLPGKEFVDPPPSDSKLGKTSPGHLRFLHSHDVRTVDCPLSRSFGVAPPEPRCPDKDATCAFAFKTLGACVGCYTVHKRGASGELAPFNQTPYWIMAVEQHVVDDHGDVWNLSLVRMLGELMEPRGFFEPGSRVMQIKTGGN